MQVEALTNWENSRAAGAVPASASISYARAQLLIHFLAKGGALRFVHLAERPVRIVGAEHGADAGTSRRSDTP